MPKLIKLTKVIKISQPHSNHSLNINDVNYKAMGYKKCNIRDKVLFLFLLFFGWLVPDLEYVWGICDRLLSGLFILNMGSTQQNVRSDSTEKSAGALNESLHVT